MSRQLDPEALDEQDVAYIKDRPMIRREFVMQGFGDPLDPEYPGLTFSSSPSPEDEQDDTEDDGDGDDAEKKEDPGYEDWKKKDLLAEIDRRNQGRDEDSENYLSPESEKNAALAHVLREDDKADTTE